MFGRTHKLLRGRELERRAEELGVSLEELGDAMGHTSEPELQRRVLAAERAHRDSSLWWIALISAVASAFSAIAAWVAAGR